MATDSIARRVAQKELRLFFASPVAWLFLASFAAATLFMAVFVTAFSLFTDALRDALDPKLKGKAGH